MLLVLHNQLGIFERIWALAGQRSYQTESIATEQLKLVALVDSNELCDAFTYTQNIDLDNNISVFRLPSRSTDIGDIIQTEKGESYLVKEENYTLMPQQPIYIHVPKVLSPERGDKFEEFPTLPIRYCHLN